MTTSARSQAAKISVTPSGSKIVSWPVPAPHPGASLGTQFAVIDANDSLRSSNTMLRAASGSPSFRGDHNGVMLAGPVVDGQVLPKPAVDELSPAGKVVAHHPITLSYPKLGAIEMAVGPSGDVVVAWIDYKEVDSDYGYAAKLHVATAAAGSPLGKPATLITQPKAAEPYDDAIAVAVGTAGNAIVTAGGLTRRGLGMWLGSARTGFSGDRIDAKTFPWSSNLSAVMTSTGRAVIASGDTNGGEEAEAPYLVSATSVAPGATAASAVQTVDPGYDKLLPSGGVLLAPGPGGTATLAWNGVDSRQPGGMPANVATADPSGTFGAIKRLGTSESINGLAVRPSDGAAVVTVTGCRSPGSRYSPVACAYARPSMDASFGKPEPLPIRQAAGSPGLSFDGRTGQPSFAYLTTTEHSPDARLVVVTRDRP